MCADIAVHDTGKGNPHAHIMLTLRPIEPDGSWGAKSYTVNGKKVNTVDWHDKDKAEQWRSAWAEAVNAEMERTGNAERIDHRSYERQGIEQIPTVHLGVAASQMERKGIATNRGNLNREIEVSNKLLRQINARLNKLRGWMKEETANTAPPTLADVIRGILDKDEAQSRYGQIRNLKAAANMLAFLTANNIKDMAGLRDKVEELYGRRTEMGGRLNRIDRRMKTLDEHLRQAGYYNEHRELYARYMAVKNPKRQAKFREENYTGIALYESAKRYLDDVMNGRTGLPLKAWQAEKDKLAAERGKLNREYVSLKNEVTEIERVRRAAENIMRTEQHRAKPPRERPRSRDMER